MPLTHPFPNNTSVIEALTPHLMLSISRHDAGHALSLPSLNKSLPKDYYLAVLLRCLLTAVHLYVEYEYLLR